MRHIKLFESFQVNEKKDEANVSLKKAKTRGPVKEAEDDDYPDFKEVTDAIDKLFKKLVPAQGPAETVEGEMIRAISRVIYRYRNDGDYFFRGYGKETALPSVNWLRKNSPLAKQLSPIFREAQAKAGKADNDFEYTKKDEYQNNLYKAAEIIAKYVNDKKGEYTKNDQDSR